MQGRDRERLAEAKCPQVSDIRFLLLRIHLVGRQHGWLAGPANELNDSFIGVRYAHRCIHDEHDGVGFPDRRLGLVRNRQVNPLDVDLPAAGIHHGELAAVPFGVVVHAITRHARGILHNCHTLSDDAVHESRLANVRASHDCQHGGCRRRLRVWHGEVEVDEREVVAVKLVVLERGAHELVLLLVVLRIEVTVEFDVVRWLKFVVSHGRSPESAK